MKRVRRLRRAEEFACGFRRERLVGWVGDSLFFIYEVELGFVAFFGFK